MSETAVAMPGAAAPQWQRFTPAQRYMRYGVWLAIVAAVVQSARSVQVIPEFLVDAPEQMADMLVRIGRLDVDDAAELGATLAQLDALLRWCRDHIRHENDFVHTAIDARLPAGAARTAADHVDHVQAIAELGAEAGVLAGTIQRAIIRCSSGGKVANSSSWMRCSSASV